MTNGVYCLTSPSGKRYVGVSVGAGGIEARWAAYRRLFCKNQVMLYNALLKHGPENFKYEVILATTDSKLSLAVEQQLIALWGLQRRSKGYNINNGGDFQRAGTKMSATSLLKISEASKRSWANASKRREEAAIRLKKLNPAVGGKSKLGQTTPIEVRLKIANSLRGRKLAPESIIKRETTKRANKLARLANSLPNSTDQANLG